MNAEWFRRTIAITVLLGSAGLSLGQDAGELFFQGYEFLEQGKASDAVAKFEEGLKAEPNNATARYYLGEAYLAVGQNKAREQMRKSLDLDANSQVAGPARKRLAELSSSVPAGASTSTGNFTATGTVIQDCPECPEMVVVPAGKFLMGSPSSEAGRTDYEGPQHEVVFAKPFAVGKYEVTFREWETCVAGKVCAQVGDNGSGRDRRPVINVSYEQALGYVEWLSARTGKKYRLLSEAEWEYAARGGSDYARFWGNATNLACQFANVYDASGKTVQKMDSETFDCDDGYSHTSPVGTFKPNNFGLYDMLGNVFEWVEDCLFLTYAGAPTDGSVRRADESRPVWELRHATEIRLEFVTAERWRAPCVFHVTGRQRPSEGHSARLQGAHQVSHHRVAVACGNRGRQAERRTGRLSGCGRRKRRPEREVHRVRVGHLLQHHQPWRAVFEIEAARNPQDACGFADGRVRDVGDVSGQSLEPLPRGGVGSLEVHRRPKSPVGVQARAGMHNEHRRRHFGEPPSGLGFA